ncbi:MAG TPA: thioesterase domain-containing protein, partial [Methylomirabilota bacterium]
GASEASGIVEYRIEPGTPLPQDRVPAGYPLEGVEILILDEAGASLRAGELGEIAVRSRYLSPGYWRRPDRTRASFLADPATGGVRVYRTGDLGRLGPDGCLEVVGRRDHQAKVRGYLVHPDEVERRLIEHPGIREAAVVARDDPGGDTHLVAYVVHANQPGPAAAVLRKFLQTRLPAYMVPAAFVSLEALPVTPNGKVDRGALPPPPDGAPATGHVRLRNPLEHEIAAIWEELFDVRPLGATDDFFDLGGNSLLAAAFVAALESAHGRIASPSLLLEASTVGDVAAALLRVKPADAAPIVALRSSGARAPLFYLHGDYNGGGLYCHALARRLDAERPFYVMDPHGIDGRPLPATIEGMAADRLAALRAVRPHGPYLLGGWCNGAVVALEMARRLRAEGESVPMTVLIDAQAPLRGQYLLQRALDAVEGSSRLPLPLRARFSARIERGADRMADRTRYYEERLYRLARSPIRNAVGLVGRSLAGSVRDLARSIARRPPAPLPPAVSPPIAAPPPLPRQRHRLYHSAFRRYAPAPYVGRAVLLRGEEEPAYRPDQGWSRILPRLQVEVIPGNHLTSITRHVDVLANRLEQILRQAEETP